MHSSWEPVPESSNSHVPVSPSSSRTNDWPFAGFASVFSVRHCWKLVLLPGLPSAPASVTPIEPVPPPHATNAKSGVPARMASARGAGSAPGHSQRRNGRPSTLPALPALPALHVAPVGHRPSAVQSREHLPLVRLQ